MQPLQGKVVAGFCEKMTELLELCELPSPHRTKTEQTTKAMPSTTQNLKQVTSVSHLL